MSKRSFLDRVAVAAGYSHESAEQIVQEALDEHAHELAEKQRAFVRNRASNPLYYGSSFWAVKGVDEAANHIDPEVSE